jgi:hypothetical protein
MLLQIPGTKLGRNIDNAGIANMNNHEVTCILISGGIPSAGNECMMLPSSVHVDFWYLSAGPPWSLLL